MNGSAEFADRRSTASARVETAPANQDPPRRSIARHRRRRSHARVRPRAQAAQAAEDRRRRAEPKRPGRAPTSRAIEPPAQPSDTPGEQRHDDFDDTELSMRACCSTALLIALSRAAIAVGTVHWTHTSEADFKDGTFDQRRRDQPRRSQALARGQDDPRAGRARSAPSTRGRSAGRHDLRRHRARRACCLRSRTTRSRPSRARRGRQHLLAC